jgi:predicted lipid-binding transport protein (Tim44 family)
MVTVFLGLRLYAVLGKRTGHEQPLRKPVEEPSVTTADAGTADVRDNGPARIAGVAPFDQEAALGVRAIATADNRFNPAEFIEGAKSAYGMILEDFWKGDVDGLSPYVSTSVRDSFADAVKARTEAGEVLDNRLVRIDRAAIASASLDGKVARIAVRFDADIAAVTRDAEGNVLAGSMTDALETHDVWTFEREIRSSDPNWILVDTDEAD